MESMRPFCPIARLVKLDAQLYDYVTSIHYQLTRDLTSATHYYITLAELSMAGIPRLSHRNEWPSHKRSLDGEVYNLHYKVAHHRWYLDNQTTPFRMTLV